MLGLGAILKVDLPTQQVSQEDIPLSVFKRFVGGEGINDWLLWQHFLKVHPQVDPLSPENILIAGLGPVGGTGFGGGSKMKWTFKSPAYNLFGDSVSGGFFGPCLRWAGYDYLVVTGKSPHPVYILIEDEEVQVRDASLLWGKDTEETNTLLTRQLGDDIEVACIGPAAENGVTFASIIVSGHRHAGRAGAGAVMASKNLKAIAVRGTRGIKLYDPKGFFKAMDSLIAAQGKILPRVRDGFKIFGTLGATARYHRTYCNAYRNNQGCRLPEEKYERLSHRWYWGNMMRSSYACSVGCPWACSSTYKLKSEGGLGISTEGFRPEYVVIASFGIMADIPDLTIVAELGRLCRLYGVDATEMGSICAFLMELYQRGVIAEKDIREWTGEPFTLNWGDHHAVERVISSVAMQNNDLGRLLKDGVYRAALNIEQAKGVPVKQFALYGKGGSTFIEEVRHTPSWALNMAVASRGACHLKSNGTLDKMNRPDISEYYFGSPDGAEPLSTKYKGASSAVCDNRTALMNCLGVCHFIGFYDPITYPLDIFTEALYSMTGIAFSPQELEHVGERVVNLEKAFNSRLGYRREHDQLCHRWLEEEIGEGPGKGWRAGAYLEELKSEYYRWHGWDEETSLPTRAKLSQLDMEDVADVLQREKCLA